MDTSSKQTWATWLTTIGMALGPGGGISIPAGVPAKIGGIVTLIGIVSYAIGNALKHQITSTVVQQQSNNTDIITKAQAQGTLPTQPVKPTEAQKTT